MALTKQQKAGTALAALALVALGVDKLFLGGGGPATASAQDVLPITPAATQAGVQTASTVPGDLLAARLTAFARTESIDPSSGVPDLFSPDEWKIQSIFGMGSRGGVTIGEQIVNVGGTYDGATLVRVSRDGATFTRLGKEFFVGVEQPRLSSGRSTAGKGR